MVIPAGFQALPLPIVQLSLAAVLKCGQSFRWSTIPLATEGVSLGSTHEYRLCLRDRVVCLRQTSETLFYRAVFPEPQPSLAHSPLREAETLLWLNDYFQLEVDLEQLYEKWAAQDKVFDRLRGRFEGIRILRQDPWENLISFICSSNNNISRITKMVTGLCQNFSPPLLSIEDASGETPMYHPFPPPSALVAPEVAATLRGLGFGYRAEFIQRTAKMLVDAHGSLGAHGTSCEPSESWLKGLRDVSTAEAREELLKFVGVGRKVADCVLLMSLDKREVVPVDTHVHQIAIKHYGLKGAAGGKTNMTPKIYDEVNTKLYNVWGDHAGWAHSVLFTADLKSFSNYGLPTPSPSVQPDTPAKRSSAAKSSNTLLPTPPETPVPSLLPLKRKSGVQVKTEIVADTLSDVLPDTISLVERVKKRRRTVVSKNTRR